MAIILIVRCTFAWDTDQRTGSIQIELPFPPTNSLNFNGLKADEFTAIATVLNEAPVHYDTSSKSIVANRVPTGGN